MQELLVYELENGIYSSERKVDNLVSAGYNIIHFQIVHDFYWYLVVLVEKKENGSE